MVSINGLSKARVLMALFNHAKPQGRGWLKYEQGDMSEGIAEQCIANGGTVYDYLQGRVMKVDISGDEFDPRLYDRDNGEGAAEAAINSIR